MNLNLKKILFITSLAFTSVQCFGQINDPKPQPVELFEKTDPQEKVYDFVDEPADYPGGLAVLRKYLSDNIVYPESALKNGIQGKCYFQFTVMDSGIVKNVKLKKGVPNCPECDKEALKVLEKMPNWIPGKVDGKNVNSLFALPIEFKL